MELPAVVAAAGRSQLQKRTAAAVVGPLGIPIPRVLRVRKNHLPSWL